MPLDLPPNVGEHLFKSGSEGYQAIMTDLTGNIVFANNLARLQAQQRFGEMDIIESRAASGLIATPIASPTTQSDKA